jgi:hypothetical protein
MVEVQLKLKFHMVKLHQILNINSTIAVHVTRSFKSIIYFSKRLECYVGTVLQSKWRLRKHNSSTILRCHLHEKDFDKK